MRISFVDFVICYIHVFARFDPSIPLFEQIADAKPRGLRELLGRKEGTE